MSATDVFYRERDAISAALAKGENPYGGYQNAVDSIYNTYGRNSGVSYQQVQGIIGEAYPQSGGGAITASSAPSGGGGTGAVVNRGAVDATQKAIDSLGIELNTGNQNINDSLGSVLNQYDRESGQNEKDYGDQTVTNTNNLAKNKQNALVAGAQGRRGLRGTLAALGALSGDGSKLADRAVTTAANQDIGGAVDTYAGNAQTLDKAIGRFRDDDKNRRAEAQTSATNQRTALEGNIASKRQQFYQDMAKIFSDGGDTGSANSYLSRAGDLNNEIASKSRVIAAPLVPKAAAFTPGDLANYLAGAGDMTVQVADGGNGPQVGPTSILAGKKKRENQSAVPTV